MAAAADDDTLLEIDEAMAKLAKEEPASAEFIKLRFFVGLTNNKAALPVSQMRSLLKRVRELRDAHEQAGEHAHFQKRLTAFRERYARRPAMLRRIEEL